MPVGSFKARTFGTCWAKACSEAVLGKYWHYLPGSSPRRAAGGIRVSPVSWSALFSPACSKSENSQKATSLNLGTHNSYWSVQYEESIPKRLTTASMFHVFTLHGATLLCLPPRCHCNPSFRYQITIPDTVREDPWTGTVMQ